MFRKMVSLNMVTLIITSKYIQLKCRDCQIGYISETQLYANYDKHILNRKTDNTQYGRKRRIMLELLKRMLK